MTSTSSSSYNEITLPKKLRQDHEELLSMCDPLKFSAKDALRHIAEHECTIPARNVSSSCTLHMSPVINNNGIVNVAIWTKSCRESCGLLIYTFRHNYFGDMARSVMVNEPQADCWDKWKDLVKSDDKIISRLENNTRFEPDSLVFVTMFPSYAWSKIVTEKEKTRTIIADLRNARYFVYTCVLTDVVRVAQTNSKFRFAFVCDHKKVGVCNALDYGKRVGNAPRFCVIYHFGDKIFAFNPFEPLAVFHVMCRRFGWDTLEQKHHVRHFIGYYHMVCNSTAGREIVSDEDEFKYIREIGTVVCHGSDTSLLSRIQQKTLHLAELMETLMNIVVEHQWDHKEIKDHIENAFRGMDTSFKYKYPLVPHEPVKERSLKRKRSSNSNGASKKAKSVSYEESSPAMLNVLADLAKILDNVQRDRASLMSGATSTVDEIPRASANPPVAQPNQLWTLSPLKPMRADPRMLRTPPMNPPVARTNHSSVSSSPSYQGKHSLARQAALAAVESVSFDTGNAPFGNILTSPFGNFVDNAQNSFAGSFVPQPNPIGPRQVHDAHLMASDDWSLL